MNTGQVTLFMSVTILAGLLAQWPMGKISDRIPRSRILRFNAAVLTLLTLFIALLPLTGALLLVATFCYGVLAFTLYPIASAFANQNVEQNDRVALSATILLTFGLGACFGPLLASGLMQLIGPSMLYAFISCCAFTLFLRLLRVNYTQKMVKRMMDEQQNAQFKMGSGDLVSSPLAAALDPRVDEDVVLAQMHDEDFVAARQQVPAGYDEDIDMPAADEHFDDNKMTPQDQTTDSERKSVAD
jgi:MFS family permease